MDERTSLAALVGGVISIAVALTVGLVKRPVWVVASGFAAALSVWTVDWITEVVKSAQPSEAEDAEAARARILAGAAESVGPGA